MTPHEVKFQLEQRLHQLSASIVGLHSVVVERNTVFVKYEVILTDHAEDALLLFEFERPEKVCRCDVPEFSVWLAQTGHDGETLH